jgi:hypothetical protein
VLVENKNADLLENTSFTIDLSKINPRPDWTYITPAVSEALAL